MEPSKKPLNVLIKQMNSYIGVTLKNNIEYRGAMVHCDSYMNIILDGASEYNNSQLIANYGKVLVRGNNILYITLNPPQKKE
ncbi:MAG: LSM domain-containing protein [Candidatus Bathyarchaeia archaeon]|jgi:small nuclear ribonucleoprotein|nr:ribonucleoprotein [Candidatus Bathyarchaeota archaeon]MBS7653789.1 ribonucleoprotein [Candidatus Bathyarchaeota archaeon]